MTQKATPADVAQAAAGHSPETPSETTLNGSQTSEQSESGQPTHGSSEDRSSGDEDFPSDTPLSEMSVDQREAYWKAQARKHEERAKSRSDYDDIKKERDQLKQENETEMERIAREAKEAGASEVREQSYDSTARALYRMALRGHGVEESSIADLLKEVNFVAFKTADGEIDDEALSRSAQRNAGTAGRKFPDMGQDRVSSKRSTGLAAGRKAFEDSNPQNKD